MKKIAIIGSGAYGSYAASLVCELHPDWEVHIYEVGDEHIKSQDEMGLYSELINCRYDALTKGRYFGWGGATAKWGGQILTFSKNDFHNPSRYLKEIVELNEKYRANIFKKVGIRNDEPERILDNGMFTKIGVWLDYFSRNLFKKFKVANNKNVILHPNSRVTRIETEGKDVKCFYYIHDGKEVASEKFDYHFLAAGAFENCRIMMVSGLQDKTKVVFSDHISKKMFRVKGTTKIGDVDFQFKIRKASFITTRLIGEENGVSYFVCPMFNAEFPFFQNLKKLLFGHVINHKIILSIIRDIPSCIAFAWKFFVEHKLYVYKNTWFITVHLENPKKGNVYLSEHLDSFGQPGLAIDFNINDEANSVFEHAADKVRDMLKENNVDFDELHEAVHTEKYEDEYHPFGLYSDFESVEDFYSQFNNMMVIHSGVLPRSGGINSTSAAFPLLEEFIRYRL